MNITPFAQLTFREATKQWLEMKRPFIGPNTIRTYETAIKAMMPFFADVQLDKITIDHFREYQRLRSAKSKGSCINRELKQTLSQILREADPWEPIKKKYKPAPLPHLTPGRALSPDELDRLFTAARLKSRWRVVFYAAVIMANTATGPGEVMHLQLQDIDLDNRAIHVRRAVKNKYRVRQLDLNEDAFAAVKWLYERALKKGCSQPDHYLFPHRAPKGTTGFVPTQPVANFHRAWGEIRKAANLGRFRIYDLRHTAITNLYSNPNIPERAIIEIAGWNSGQMAARYAHIRREVKRNALPGLATGTMSNTSSTAFQTAALPSQEGKPPAPLATGELKPTVTGTIAFMPVRTR